MKQRNPAPNSWIGQLIAKPEKPKAQVTAPASEIIKPDFVGPELPAFPKPKSIDEAREWLLRLSEQLEQLRFPDSPVTVELAKYAAGAFREYLKEAQDDKRRAGPLEHALGLSAQPGRPADEEENIKIARKVWNYRLRGLTNAQIRDAEEAQTGKKISEDKMRTWSAHAKKYEVLIFSERVTWLMNMSAEERSTNPEILELMSRPAKFKRLQGIEYHGQPCGFGHWEQTGDKALTWICGNPLVCDLHKQ